MQSSNTAQKYSLYLWNHDVLDKGHNLIYACSLCMNAMISRADGLLFQISEATIGFFRKGKSYLIVVNMKLIKFCRSQHCVNKVLETQVKLYVTGHSN